MFLLFRGVFALLKKLQISRKKAIGKVERLRNVAKLANEAYLELIRTFGE